MSLTFVAEVWEVLSSHINHGYDRDEAADSLVNLFIDNNYDVEEIKDAFRGDKVIIKALQSYMDQHEEDYEDDDYYDDDDDDDDEW